MPKVRDAIRLVRQDGWYHVRTRGSHRQYTPRKAWNCYDRWKARRRRANEDMALYHEAGRTGLGRVWMRYTVVIEEGPTSYGAYVPDLPGCVAAADSREEVCDLIREAIALHLELLREYGDPIPEPTSTAVLVDV